MWRKAEIYDALYNSEGMTASSVLSTLQKGLAYMLSNPSSYKELNPPNGWGSYETAIDFLQHTIDGFKRFPKALIRVSR